MRILSSIIHKCLLYMLIGVVTLVLAMLISITVQDSIGNLRRLTGTSWPVQLMMILPIWVLLCLPRFRFRAIVEPHQGSHIIAQLGFGAVATVCVLLAAAYAAESPLSLVFWYKFQSGLSALACGALVILTVFFGIIRAIVFASTTDSDTPLERTSTFLAKSHQFAKSMASLTAMIIGGTIIVSVLVIGRPTSPPTIIYALTFLLYAVLLGWPRFELQAIIHPSQTRHVAPQLGLMFVAVYSIERITRALLYHSSQFSSFDDIEAIYPAVENALMLPFIIFALIGVARALPKTERADPKINATEVFG